MYILGINAYHADSSAAIFKDGVMMAAIEEERFTRVKHWAGFPVQAIRFCLQEVNIDISQLDYIAIGRDPKAKLMRKMAFLLRHPSMAFTSLRERVNNRSQISSLENEFVQYFPGAEAAVIKSKIVHVEHHRAHLASAFFASPFDEAALISIDGSGDFSTTMIGRGNENQIEVLGSVDFPHSIGLFYTAFTQFLGFPHYGDEYKVMGLAPYGTPIYIDKLKEVLHRTYDGFFRLNLDYFTATKSGIISYSDDHKPLVGKMYSNTLSKLFGPPRTQGSSLTQDHMNIAASVQRFTEDTIFYMMNALYEKTKLDAVCVAGGVAQNSVANGKITSNTPFKHVYIPSAGHDAGISMGSALYANAVKNPGAKRYHIQHAYWGSRFEDQQIEDILQQNNVTYRKLSDDNIFAYVADRIVDGAVVGWFCGRAEFGPRALGGRSILIDPRRTDAKELLNAKIKRRESFRPFAPSILAEHVHSYFEIADEVPFMEKVFPIKKEKHDVIPAVTHVDGTGRLQTVTAANNPRYHALIHAFFTKTGVPVLLNTSFNENEPIVNTPQEALNCYLRTNMDLLVLENYIIERSQTRSEHDS